MNERIALFAGTFDPPTLGHLNIIERGAKLFDKLIVVVANNISKKCLFTPEERQELVKTVISEKHLDNVDVITYDGLLVNLAREKKAQAVIRGLRNSSDFSQEFDMALYNKLIAPEIETIFLPTEEKYYLARSSEIKEMARFGADISSLVSESVLKKVIEKFQHCNQ